MDNVYQVMRAHLDILDTYDKASEEFDGTSLAVELENNLGQLVTDFTEYSQDALDDLMVKRTLPERIKMWRAIVTNWQWTLVELKLTDNTVAYWMD